MKRGLTAALVVLVTAVASAQGVSLEYRVKAAFLYNFVKFVEWPGAVSALPICVAGRNPFMNVLSDLVDNERVRGATLMMRVIKEPETDCSVLFVPEGVAPAPYLRTAANRPVLTVGESPDFIRAGGMVRFYLEGTSVRFEINPDKAARAGLRISARLLQLARIASEDAP